NALGNRARKSGQGILTVRFEMPFPIWCTTCPKPTIIGQGVRFNAEKKKVGNYYSTPIFSFRMKHVACGGWIEIQTDPKNTAYVVTEGAKKRDIGDDKVHEGEIQIRTDEERERLQQDAFAALEVKIDDRKQATTDKSRIEELQLAKEKDWDDPYAASKKLRRAFRADRKVRQKNEDLTEDLKDRMSLGMDLLEETEDDRQRAQFVEFGDFGQSGSERAVHRAHARPFFANDTSTGQVGVGSTSKTQTKTKTRQLKSLQELEMHKEKFRRELRNNTRAMMDPFLTDSATAAAVPSASITLGIKRKRDLPSNSNVVTPEQNAGSSPVKQPLVAYDSD
ncbi:MAG: hypothetical protein Q9187_008633, partial [Circinaria calcarea]